MIEKLTKKIVFKIIKERFVKEVPFLKLLSIKVSKFDYPEVEMVLNWNNLLMGNVVQESLHGGVCLLYTSPSPRDYAASRMPSSA